MNPVIMHVNYGEMRYNSYGTKSVADICKMAAEIGYDGIEFRSAPPKELEGLSMKEYFGQIADGQKDCGLKHILMGVAFSECMNPDADARQKDIDHAVEKIKYANDLFGTTVFNIFGAYIPAVFKTAPAGAFEFTGSGAATIEQWDIIADTFRLVAKEIEPLGVKLAFETHMNYIHDLPSASKKLVDLIDSPAIGINMDYGNTAYFPEKPTVTEAIDLYGDKLFYTHLKNSTSVAGKRMATALSDGEINHREYIAKLHEVGFDGPIGIEAPRPGDRYWFAQKDLDYYKAVVASI